MVDLSEYKVGVIKSLEPCGKCNKSSKKLMHCKIDIGSQEEISVVTSAPNVRLNSRIVVAPVGSIIIKKGEEVKVTKASVGGVTSEGVLCDSEMLGWSGGAVGIAVQVPNSYEPGKEPPSSKPRMDGLDNEKSGEEVIGTVEGLFSKKLSKEEKKKIAEAKRKAKREAKAAAKAAA